VKVLINSTISSHFDTFFKEILESMDLKTHKIDMFYMESTTNSSFIFTVNNLFFEPRNYKIEFPANKMYFTAIGTS
jgi:hypothetical protein